MKKNEKIKETIALLPHSPGVYQFFNSDGDIIYVGKAVDLKRRVSSYFTLKAQDNVKLRSMVAKIANIKHIVVVTESDALFLENNIIKKMQPRYNVMLKDDKTYPWICVKNEKFPRVFITRRKIKDGSQYFGPYSSVTTIRTLLEFIQKTFFLRTCNFNLSEELINKSKFKPCLEYHIGNCKAPCVAKQTQQQYDNQINHVISILNGDVQNVISLLREEMNIAAKEYRYEDANILKGKINKLKNYQSKSIVISAVNHNVDIVSILKDEDVVFANFMRVVHGSIIQSQNIELKPGIEDTPKSILSFVIMEMKHRLGVLSREIVVPFLPDKLFENIKFFVPQRGKKLKLLELSNKNIKAHQLEILKQMKIVDPDRFSNRMLSGLQKDLKLNTLPKHIECFDNSNISGQSAVASCVVFKNAKPCKEEYRKYNIKTVDGSDDYASMREVVFRRYSRLIAEKKEFPDLIIADGGKGQMETVRKIIEDELGLNIPIVGLAKDDKHRTNQLLFGFPPKVVAIKPTEPHFKLLAQIQNEVHRFAIEFHRQKRSAAMIKSELSNINGVGEKSIEKLLVKFHSVSRVRKADFDDVSKIVGKKIAKSIFDYFGGNDELT